MRLEAVNTNKEKSLGAIIKVAANAAPMIGRVIIMKTVEAVALRVAAVTIAEAVDLSAKKAEIAVASKAAAVTIAEAVDLSAEKAEIAVASKVAAETIAEAVDLSAEKAEIAVASRAAAQTIAEAVDSSAEKAEIAVASKAAPAMTVAEVATIAEILQAIDFPRKKENLTSAIRGLKMKNLPVQRESKESASKPKKRNRDLDIKAVIKNFKKQAIA